MYCGLRIRTSEVVSEALLLLVVVLVLLTYLILCLSGNAIASSRQIHAKIGLTSASQRLCRSYYSADGKKLPKEMESAMTFDDGGESFKDRMRRALGPSIDAKTNSNNSMSTAVLPDMIMAQQQSAVVTNLASATTPPA